MNRYYPSFILKHGKDIEEEETKSNVITNYGKEANSKIGAELTALYNLYASGTEIVYDELKSEWLN